MTAPAIVRPKLWTPPTEGRAHYGPAIGKIGAALGRPPMPHQQLLNRITTEMLPTGEWAYTTVIFSTPRQAGKTTARAPIAIHRCLIRPMARCWLTAQTRQDARDILVDDVGPLWRGSPLRSLATLRRSQGSEGLMFRTGAFWRVFAPGEDDLHGKANELVDVDEAWKFPLVDGVALEQAIGPTFTTTDGQMSLFSTRGTARSTWLDKFIDLGTEAVLAGRREGIAMILYALPDELVDQVRAGLHDEKQSPAWRAAVQTVIDHHPAHGYTLKPRAVASEAEKMEPDEFLRAYGNIPTRTEQSIINPARWADCRANDWPAPSGPIALALEVGIDRADAAIAAAWPGPDGTVYVDVIAHRPGADWIPELVTSIASRWPLTTMGHAGAGPVVETAERVTLAGVELVALKAGEYAAACAAMVADIDDGRLRHPGHPALDAAVANVATRPLGDGGYAFARTKSEGSITTLVAATVARRLALHTSPPAPSPMFVPPPSD